MIEKISVWGDSVLKGIVLDSDTGRYTRLNEKGCVPTVSKELGIPIANHSKYGMTSEKGKGLILREYEQGETCDVGIICFGGNDVDHDWPDIAAHPDSPHEPRIPLESFCSNLQEMVTTVSGHGAVPILVTIPPISAERYFSWFSRGIEKSGNILRWLGDVGYIYRMHELYSDAILKVSKTLGCRAIDMRQPFLKMRSYLDTLCIDGIHPNEYGHQLMASAFVQYARENLQ